MWQQWLLSTCKVHFGGMIGYGKDQNGNLKEYSNPITGSYYCPQGYGQYHILNSSTGCQYIE